MKKCYVLSNYPLSTSYKQSVEEDLQAAPHYFTVADLRSRPTRHALKYLWGLKGDLLLLALEDANSNAVLPVLQLMSMVTRVRRVAVATPDRGIINFPRWQAVNAAASFASTSRRCISSLRTCRRELESVANEERFIPAPSRSMRIAYLNANLWFGVKAGGSVGHISGVVNAFLNDNYDVEFFSAGSRLMVDSRARYTPLDPPIGYGIPFDGNYYRFNRSVTDAVGRKLDRREWAFIYQRMSVANYSGVTLSRQFRIPLVLEYNGSEVWIARKWGRPLTHPGVAENAENVCLKHAHAVVTVSDVLRDQLIERGVSTDRIVTYPNCIDPLIFNPSRFSAEDISKLRARYGIPPDALVVGFLGTFGQWHGIEIMGNAIRLLAEQNRSLLERKKVHFLIIGDGLRMNALRDILSSDRCQGLYTLPGLVRQEEAPLHIAASDILLSPHVRNGDNTRFFGSPTKLFEYMAMGKAIIASDMDQISDVLKGSPHCEELVNVSGEMQDKALAVLCPPGDPKILAEAVKLLVMNPRWRETIGRNARREALGRYTWQHHVRAIEDRLRDLNLLVTANTNKVDPVCTASCNL